MFIFRRRKLIFIFLTIIVTFIILTFSFMSILMKSESKVIQSNIHTEEKIRKILLNLPDKYFRKYENSELISSDFIKYINDQKKVENLQILWNEANSWLSKTQIYNIHPHLGNVLFALKHAKIIKADLDSRGSQLKFLLTLEDNQEVIFKPKRYEKGEVIEGVVYAGKDRYGSEILGFYLSGIFEKLTVPLSIERLIHVKNELLPVATKNLLETTFTLNNKTCIYGKCYYCTKSDPVCEDDINRKIAGAVIFNIKGNMKIYKSPWKRIYKKGKLAEWQVNDNYCKIVSKTLSSKRIYDLVDVSIFDFLIQNGDRHHYEVLNGNIVWLDNGKGLGNPNIDHIDILAPLYQCCQIRTDTWKRLQLLSGGALIEKLKLMPGIRNFVSDAHFDALERRLLIVYATMEYCMVVNKEKNSIL